MSAPVVELPPAKAEPSAWERVASTVAKGSWQDRAALACMFLRAGDIVCDLGAGSQPLKNYLPEGVGYLAVDCVDVIPGTHLADFNSPDFTLPAKDFNVLIALGVVNWLKDAEKFLDRLAQVADGKFFIFTYDLWQPDGQQRTGKGHEGLESLDACMEVFSRYMQNLTPAFVFRRRVIFTGTLSRAGARRGHRPSGSKLYLKYLRPQEYLILKLFNLNMMPRWLA
jgi:hypothetical protein